MNKVIVDLTVGALIMSFSIKTCFSVNDYRFRENAWSPMQANAFDVEDGLRHISFCRLPGSRTALQNRIDNAQNLLKGGIAYR